MTTPMPPRLERRALGLLTVALLAVALYRGAALLLAEPLLALANNYDMVRVQACIKAYPVRSAEIPPWWGSGDAPIERYRFRDDVDAPCFRTTEVIFARLARPLFKAESQRSGDGSFSIRWLGLVKFSLFFVAAAGFSFAWWRRGQPRAAFANAAIAALVLADPAVTLYLNGFYAEYSTVLFGYASVAGAALLIGCGQPPRLLSLALLALAVTGLVASKVQHAGLGLVLLFSMALPAVFGAAIRMPILAALAVGAAAGLALQAGNLARTENEVMRLANMTSTVLTSLLPLSDDPARTAENLGLPRRCGEAAGVNWYLPPIRENPANHPCPEVGKVSHLRLLTLAAVEPRVFAIFLGRGIDYLRPWIPSTYRGQPHLGVVAGRTQAPLPDGWFSWSRTLDAAPLWSIRLLVLTPMLLVTALVALRRLRDPALAATLSALAWLLPASIVAVVLGNGYEDAAKQMHLVFASALAFWILLALAVLAGAVRRGAQRPPATARSGR